MPHGSLVLCVLLCACGDATDERPVTFEVVTLEVLAPTCGQVQCHSTTTVTQGYAFDTLEAARSSMLANGTAVMVGAIQHDEGFDWMPPDLPMLDEDKQLFLNWVDAGEPGLRVP